MSNYCIISEFNPLHNGHAYLFDQARASGADTVTCIMSGNSTQRGELSIVDKYTRAGAAIECGADLVLELPFPWCAASAEYFAGAGVYIAGFFGDTLFFGSESGDVRLLTDAAKYCVTEEFATEYELRTRNGEGAANAFFECLSQKGFSNVLSNDLLGISYIKAIISAGYALEAKTTPRIGAGYNDAQSYGDRFSSATAIRELIRQGRISELSAHVPSAMQKALTNEAVNGRITDISEADSAVLSYFRLASPRDFENVADTAGGIANRLISVARQSVSADDMLEKLRTKRYTDAKMRRAMLYCLTKTPQDILKRLPEYTVLLGANEKGRALLARNKKIGGIDVVTKSADAPRETEQYILSERLDLLYGLARKNKMTADAFFQKNAYIVK